MTAEQTRRWNELEALDRELTPDEGDELDALAGQLEAEYDAAVAAGKVA